MIGTASRIDFIETPKKDPYATEPKMVVIVKKFSSYETSYGKTGWSPMSNEVNETMTLDEMIAWCESAGYVVRRWPNGARAFLGKPTPVRSGRDIQALRARLQEQKDRGTLREGLEIHAINLAFDL